MLTKLPPEDHVVRWVRKRELRRDSDDNVIGVLPDAFNRRKGEEYLSSTWLEHFSPDYEKGLSAAAAAIRRQLEVKPRDGFTVGSVGKIVETCSRFEVRVRLLHEGTEENTGYSAIRGIPRDHMELFEMLAADVFTDTRVASSIPAPAEAGSAGCKGSAECSRSPSGGPASSAPTARPSTRQTAHGPPVAVAVPARRRSARAHRLGAGGRPSRPRRTARAARRAGRSESRLAASARGIRPSALGGLIQADRSRVTKTGHIVWQRHRIDQQQVQQLQGLCRAQTPRGSQPGSQASDHASPSSSPV